MKQSPDRKLLSRLPVGQLELKNRIVFASPPTNFGENNLISKQHVAYYHERAAGGAGMIVVEEQLVHPSDLPYQKALYGYTSESIPHYRALSQKVKPYGTILVALLNHHGLQSDGSLSMHELWAPSPVSDVASREVPKTMDKSDIQQVIEGFAVTAGNVVAGGLDGVEVNAAHFSLIRQFISPLTNQRNDAYGGNPDNRLRFCLEVLRAVRTVIGTSKILGLKLCGDELAPWGGITAEDAVAIAGELEAVALLDYLTIVIGGLYSPHLAMPTHYIDPSQPLTVAGKIKNAVKLPVFVEGRMHQPDHVGRIIEEGLADGVYMNRALICDPYLPAKLAQGRENTILGCLSCNQGCQVRGFIGKPLSCTVNPTVGTEAVNSFSTSKRVTRPQKVLVIGGGPSGLEASRRAARRGHKVTLWESEESLGGKLLLNPVITQVSSRLIEVWEAEIKGLGVQVGTGKQATAEDILSEGPDVLVLATGSVPGQPTAPIKNCQVKSTIEVLKNPASSQGQVVLLWDEVGNQVMARAVESLLSAGCQVYLVTPDLFAGMKLAQTWELTSWNQNVMGKGITIITSSRIKEVDSHHATLENVFSGKLSVLENIGTLIHNCWPKPDESLYFLLKDHIDQVYRVGDCLAPRGIEAAVREGFVAGNVI